MKLLSLPTTLQPLQDNIISGISLFKGRLSYAGEKTVDCITQVVLPINNFLKDIQQIETEFDLSGKMVHDFTLCMDGRMVPASEVLKWDMEENY
ncbi:MAG: hypothetical protein QM687_09435 [Ferruginibacter sp.]